MKHPYKKLTRLFCKNLVLFMVLILQPICCGLYRARAENASHTLGVEMCHCDIHLCHYGLHYLDRPPWSTSFDSSDSTLGDQQK